ncbi:hypothetical protein HDU91_001285 [Kappamyces sp. JEL0680]|nr:hypothetical protein HDU91_001285 [Kappamyces sp. JEL0680]
MDISELKAVNERLQRNEDRIKEIEGVERETKVKEAEAEGELKKAKYKYDAAVDRYDKDPSLENKERKEDAKYSLNTAKEILKGIRDELKSLRQELKDEFSEVNQLKRQLEESSSSMSKRSSNSSRPGQKAFVKRLKDRDGISCVISKSKKVKGAHIIPFAWAKSNPAMWLRDYQRYCRVPEHGVDDVRNGIILSSSLHDQFDDFWFTIEFKDDVYTIKAGSEEEMKPLDGKLGTT